MANSQRTKKSKVKMPETIDWKTLIGLITALIWLVVELLKKL